MVATAAAACCSTVSTRIVLFWFAALIPPASEDDVDYYEILGIAGNASPEEIRKAYKKKSLTLHPDKILQRGGNPDDYREEYQLIQQAHTVLVDDKKRQKYNLVNRSSSRYEFLTDDGALVGAYDNLVKSSCALKSRLVLLVAIILSFLLLQPILVGTKVNHVLKGGGALEDVPWTLILIPWWVFQILIFAGLLAISLIANCGSNLSITLKLLEHLTWVLGQIFLALRWDESIEWDYAKVFIPIYLALALRNLGRLATMQQLSNDIGRLTTVQQLEEEVLGKSYDDCTEEEREQVTRQYIIIQLPPDAMPPDFVDPEDADDFMISQSTEYQQMMDAYYHNFAGLVNGIIFGIPLVILIVLKVDTHIEDTSWWLIFMPVWVYFGAQLCWNCYSCCCASISGEEIVVGTNNMAAADDDYVAGVPSSREETSEFVEPNSSMRQFNASIKTSDAAVAADVVVAAGPTDDGIRVTSSTSNDETAAMKDESKPPLTATEAAIAAAVKKASTPAASKPAEEAKQETPTDTVDEEMPEIDEETFENMRQAYQQAEHSAMEAQAKAFTSLCGLLFQFMMVCLVVGKLAQADDDDEIGFNCMWILFPFFLIAGCALCCTACIIYGAGADGLDSLVERAAGERGDGDDRDEEEQAQDAGGMAAATGSPVVIIPPASMTALATDENETPTSADNEEKADVVSINTDPNGFYDDDVD